MYHVLVVEELNMPLGKYIAQVAHGAVQLLIDRFSLVNGELTLTDETAIQWLKNWVNQKYCVEIQRLDMDKFNSGYYHEHGTISPIHDLGRTVFNGKRTLTVAGYTTAKLPQHAVAPVDSYNANDEMRQIFLVNQQHSGATDKYTLAAKVAALSVASVMKHSRFYDDKVVIKASSDLKEWLFASAAKVVLKSKTQNPALRALNSAKERDIGVASDCANDDNLLAMAFGPARKSQIDQVTKRFRLL